MPARLTVVSSQRTMYHVCIVVPGSGWGAATSVEGKERERGGQRQTEKQRAYIDQTNTTIYRSVLNESIRHESCRVCVCGVGRLASSNCWGTSHSHASVGHKRGTYFTRSIDIRETIVSHLLRPPLVPLTLSTCSSGREAAVR